MSLGLVAKSDHNELSDRVARAHIPDTQYNRSVRVKSHNMLNYDDRNLYPGSR
jgi:hypothetical protein